MWFFQISLVLFIHYFLPLLISFSPSLVKHHHPYFSICVILNPSLEILLLTSLHDPFLLSLLL